MTARSAATASKFALAGAASVCALVLAACTNFYEIPIETPIQPKMDVSGFQRVLVAGFVSGGTEDVDSNLETVRLLRSQLRTKSPLRVIEAEVLPLADIAATENAAASSHDSGSNGTNASNGTNGPGGANGASNGSSANGSGSSAPNNGGVQPVPQLPAADIVKPNDTPKPAASTPTKSTDVSASIKSEKDLAKFDKIFADVAYWKKLGEEYQSPLIVTGTVLFTPQQSSGFVMTQQEVYDAYGRRSVIPVRTYQERSGFILQPRFVFIDGRTGAILYSETFREEVLYPKSQSVPALSTYFELMDRVVPSFLSTLSAQKIKGTRILLK
jgi:hypothetical protein